MKDKNNMKSEAKKIAKARAEFEAILAEQQAEDLRNEDQCPDEWVIKGQGINGLVIR